MRNAVLAVAIAVVVALSAFTAPAAAAYGSVSVEAALENDIDETTLEFTFYADQNGTVTVGDDGSIQTDSGNVEFSFSGWSGGGDSGSDSTWTVESGTRYTVEYAATATSGATESQHSATVTVDYQSGGQVASESLDLEVNVLEPAFGYVGGASGDLVFEGDTAETTVTVDVPNDGDGVMVVEDVSFSGVPSGISASTASTPDQISAGDSGSLGIDVTADSSVEEGTYRFDATVTDSLGNKVTFPVEVDVSKPPVADVDGGSIDLGDVLVGQSKSVNFQIQEVGGYQGLSGLDVQVTSGDPNGGLSVDVPWDFSTSAGGSGEVTATITADQDARQHQSLDFTLALSGTDRDSPQREVDVTGRVIYPAQLGSVSASPDTLVFDEPRTDVSAHRMETDVEIPNTGDLEMDVTSVSASVSDPGISASVSGTPNTVGGTETATSTVTLAADTDTPEGTYTVQVDVQTADAGSDTITREFEVKHQTDLAVEKTDVQFGEVTITDRVSQSIDVGERLGYNDLENVTVSLTSGPDQWLNISSRPPTTINAGESAPLVFDLQFDTDAEAYQQYTWDVRVEPDNVEGETITVSATAQLLSVEGITSDLDDRASGGGWQQQAADDTTSALSSMEQRLRDGENVSASDIWRSLTIGQSTVILIDSVETVEQQHADRNYEAAQSRVVSALVAHNLIDEYVSELDDSEAAAQLRDVVETTEDPVARVVEEQKTYYEDVLASEDATALQRYSASSSLATLERHQGNGDQADEYAARAEEEFSEYQSLVDEGIDRRQRARKARDALTSNATLTVLGQPVVANPARLDTVQRLRQATNDNYDAAVQRFSAAGATAEADATADEAAAASRTAQLTEYGLYGFTAVYAVVFVVFIVREVLNARTYIRETREAASGNFLL
ncbi:COG1361 family protein [Halobacterium salinarum]|uniref:Probable secreted glycoprotein n=1 Tax=Halobacterium salinarum (strain ATCC 29341 / DSM 671 / R1) TaxID=478009 RepID=B0R995_HALS3|nr:hypothetical protein [Halobacterium salinarum]CAP15400.1 probable secreted glycoprotein [Halobacterium salinarum R1]